MKLDLHTHILPERWPDLAQKYGYPGFVRLDHHRPCGARMMIGDKTFREIDDRCWRPQRRIEDCSAAGVDVQVLSTVPIMFNYWAKPRDALDLSRLLNDHIASVVRESPKRFIGLGTLPLQDPDLAIRELERCVLPPEKGGLGLPGIEIGTHVEANTFTGRAAVWNLNAAELFPVFEAAAERGAAVFVHPWDMLGKQRMPDYWLPWLVGMPAETSLAICSMIFGGVFERLATLRVCFAHGGGAFPFTIGRIAHGFDRRPDLVAVDNEVDPRAYLAKPIEREQRGGSGCAAQPSEEHGRHGRATLSSQEHGRHGRATLSRDHGRQSAASQANDGLGSGPGGEPLRPARFWVDSLVHDADALRFLLRLFSDRRVCLGSDYPFPLGEAVPGKLIESMDDLTAKTRARLLSEAAREFLGQQRFDAEHHIG